MSNVVYLHTIARERAERARALIRVAAPSWRERVIYLFRRYFK